MKNKFNLKDIIKKIRSNKAEETINTVLLVVAGLVLVALFIGIVIGSGKNAINQTGGMIDSVLNSVDADSSNTTEEDEAMKRLCDNNKLQLLGARGDLEECNNTYYETNCYGSVCMYRHCILNDHPRQWYYTDEDLRETLQRQINSLERERTFMGCPL